MPKVKVLKPFNSKLQGGLVDVGDTVEVDQVRADELARNGLVEPVTAEKAAPEPDNKAVRASRRRAKV